jgi:hypothetical protein
MEGGIDIEKLRGSRKEGKGK